MNANATIPAVPPAVVIEPQVRLLRLMPGLGIIIGVFDICFWQVDVLGASLALFVVVLVSVILANRDPIGVKGSAVVLLTLLAGAALAVLIETGTTNILVLLILIGVLAGETFFAGVEEPWGRWLSQVVAMIRAPGRLFWLGLTLLQAGLKSRWGLVGGVLGTGLLALPALILALIFGSLLAAGNTVFGSWTQTFFDALWKTLALYLDFNRITLWCLVAMLALPLLRPVNVSRWWWGWTQRLPRFPEIIPAQTSIWSSGLVLLVLNLLFLAANGADAIFLWSGAALPAGVTYSGYVHHGAETLMITALLSAVVLATIFQQSTGVVRSRGLKALAFLWVAQNLFLILSVVLRLKLYIEAYDMSVLRLSMALFLVLVTAGYVLLTIKIWQDRSLSWLIGVACWRSSRLSILRSFWISPDGRRIITSTSGKGTGVAISTWVILAS